MTMSTATTSRMMPMTAPRVSFPPPLLFPSDDGSSAGLAHGASRAPQSVVPRKALAGIPERSTFSSSASEKNPSSNSPVSRLPERFSAGARPSSRVLMEAEAASRFAALVSHTIAACRRECCRRPRLDCRAVLRHP
ncbi:Os11g0164750 [Oryza sativa Japonica Group]|uniref:Os11g0164750 protein n=1 Tax=Oryza sativa subsp. japonica TaxID=39947 RepID=A0A0P0XZC4_ORYSJ|nr:Os11g0164750 [Oryza sativa Japonica Group]